MLHRVSSFEVGEKRQRPMRLPCTWVLNKFSYESAGGLESVQSVQSVQPWVLKFIAKMQRLATTPAVSPFKHGFGFYPAFATKSSGLLNTKNPVVNSNQFLNTCLQVLSLSFPLGQLVQTHSGQAMTPWPLGFQNVKDALQSATLHLLRDGAEQENIRFGRITELRMQNKTSPSPPRRSQSNEK